MLTPCPSASWNRIIINRKAAMKAKDKRKQYLSELEYKIQSLQSKSNTFSAQLTLLQVNQLEKNENLHHSNDPETWLVILLAHFTIGYRLILQWFLCILLQQNCFPYWCADKQRFAICWAKQVETPFEHHYGWGSVARK